MPNTFSTHTLLPRPLKPLLLKGPVSTRASKKTLVGRRLRVFLVLFAVWAAGGAQHVVAQWPSSSPPSPPSSWPGMPSPSPLPTQPDPSQGGSGETISYYGSITAVDADALLVGGYRVKGDSPWLPLIAPGMLIEVEGYRQGTTLIATQIRILYPQYWVYYQGPAAPLGIVNYTTVEAWFVKRKEGEGGQQTFSLRVGKSGTGIRVIAYYDGKHYLALLDVLPPAPRPSKQGWMELLARYEDGKVVWTKARPFP